MDQQTTYALLAADSYFDTRRDFNRAPLPPGWKVLEEFTVSGSGPNATITSSGFSARVYQGPSNEIVISHAGTEFNLNDNKTGGLVDFTSGNIPLAIGQYGEQAFQAALLYEQVQARFGSAADITFTGHSLGGGLASLMAVWFDRSATVFAPAPFEASASTTSPALLRTKLKLELAGFFDPRFEGYLSIRDFSARESRVTSYSVAGKVLHQLPLAFIWGGQEHLLCQTGAAAISLTQRHSIDLHAAALLSPGFQSAADAMPKVLTMLFDSKLYGNEPVGTKLAALIRLVRGQVGSYSPSTGQQLEAPTNLLDKFVTDVDLLRGSSGTVTQLALRRALIATSIEYFFLKAPTEATQLFAQTGNAVSFRLTDIDADPMTLKSPRMLVNAVWSADEAEPYIAAAETAARNAIAWHIQSGTGAMTWIDGEGLDDAAIGGTQGDTLDGANGNDLLMGLGGADTLKGGAGSDLLLGGDGADWLDGGDGFDRLIGGNGADTYHFSGAWGSDTLRDSGNDGVISINGLGPIDGAGAKLRGNSTDAWITDDGKITYTRVSADGTHSYLLISVTNGANNGTIRINDWSQGRMGIALGSEPAAQEPANPFDGDVAKAIIQDSGAYSRTVIDSGVYNYNAAGVQVNAPDVLNGTQQDDDIHGFGGNDGLAGRNGADRIDGGAGNDLLLGGTGRDTLIGGEGNDIILGSALGHFDTPTQTDFTPPALPAGQVERARGFNWVAYRAPGTRVVGDNANFLYGAVVGAETGVVWQDASGQATISLSGKTIDAGGGNDLAANDRDIRSAA
jgi:hypothetical protein